MNVEDIQRHMRAFQHEGKRIFVSSSFQTHSIPLLHVLANSGVPFDTVFLQTGYHFPETLTFKDEVSALLGLQVVTVQSSIPMHMQRDSEGHLLYMSDPSWCCQINKTEPMKPLLQSYDIWISGVRKSQSSVRATFDVFQPTLERATRFHPILDWTDQQIYRYRMAHHLPAHPLEDDGYVSIGCAPCTRRWSALNPREGRWFGMGKTECGLQTELIGKKERPQ